MFIARKNGKTLLGAAIALYLLFADREPGAELYSVAADRDQGAIMFDTARGMVEASSALSRRCEIYRRSIVVPATSSAYHVLSADAPSKHGENSHGILFDGSTRSRTVSSTTSSRPRRARAGNRCS